MPDMALYLQPYKSNRKREGALVGIRTDAEKTVTDAGYGNLLNLLRRRFRRVEDFDTHVYKNLTDDQAKEQMIQLWERMSGAEIVVTDRLHGMVFAALTQTPCVLLPGKSHKIEGVFRWVEELDYVRFAGEESEIEEAIRQVMSVENPTYSLPEISKRFDQMAELIRRNC